MVSGIYKIENLENGKVYVGSAVDLEKRFRAHLSTFRLNKHKNQFLQNVYNKYGEEIFEFFIIEYVEDKENLINREQYYIDSYGFDSLYNINPVAGNCLGRKVSEETKSKISIALMGNKPTNAFKKGHTVNVGRKVSAETREKLSVVNTGKKHSEETKKKLSEVRKGKKLSVAHKKKISDSLHGRVLSKEHVAKLVKVNLGKRNPNYGSKREVYTIGGIEHFKCCRCKKCLPGDKFNKCSTLTHGLYPSCKGCRSKYRKKRYRERKLRENR